MQESQDRLFTEITADLFEAAAPQAGETVIDIGCGAGETTLRAAAITGRALGVDVSEPMLALAAERGRGMPARFASADATAYDFSGEPADLLISRFGVMFFAEPLKSFANLRRALKPGGRLAFVCWRVPALNPWAMAPYAARQAAPAAASAGRRPTRPVRSLSATKRACAAFSKRRAFSTSTWSRANIRLDLGVGEGLDSAVDKSMALGPTSRALGRPAGERRRGGARRDTRGARRTPRGGEVRLPAAIWIVRATT